MTDLIKGYVTLPEGYQVCPSTTEKAFISSNDGINAKLVIDNNDYTSYKTTNIPFLDENVIITLFFHNNHITQVQVYFELGESNTVNEAAYIKHWLIHKLGQPPYLYDWGEIKVISDNRSDFSVLAVLYKQAHE